MSVSVCIPMKDYRPTISRVIAALDFHHVSEILIDDTVPLRAARLRLAERASSRILFNLDSDILAPTSFLAEALPLFEAHPQLGAVALRFEQPALHTHPNFGCSLIPRRLMRAYYNYQGERFCECISMWTRLSLLGYWVRSLPLRAQHLKPLRR